MNYWVVTLGGSRIGPYEEYADAFWAALNYFGFDAWIITSSK